MHRRSPARVALITTFVLALGSMIGCYQTRYVLGDVASAKVDAGLLGNWLFDGMGLDGKETASLVVRDLDGKRYAIEWTTSADNKTLRMNGFVADVRGISFIHATPLDEKGRPEGNTHMLIRIDREDDVLTLSHLDHEFFEGEKVSSNASLRKVVEANLENPNMYMIDVLVGKRQKA